MTYLKIALYNTGKIYNQLFTYELPKEKLDGKEKYNLKEMIGRKVLVTFGHGHRTMVGFVMVTTEEQPDFATKPIISVMDDGIFLSLKDVEMIEWMRRYYLSTYYECINLFIPSGTTSKIIKQYRQNRISTSNLRALTKQEKVILDALTDKFKTVDEIAFELNGSIKTIKNRIKKMVNDGVVEEKEIYQTKVKNQTYELIKLKEGIGTVSQTLPNHYVAQKKLLEFLENKPQEFFKLQPLLKSLELNRTVAKTLQKKGFVQIETSNKLRRPKFYSSNKSKRTFELNQYQKKISDEFFELLNQKDKSKDFLLHGVTGSGKTELYIKWVEHFVSKGQTCFVLLPEIALTPQMIDRFASVFGENQIAVLHSKLSLGEKFDQWKAIRNNQYKIIIGARSGIFAPTDNIGLVIIDEEHENSYKSDSNPKYYTHQVARKKVGQEVPIIYGSATPSIQKYYMAEKGKINLLRLTQRFNEQSLPEVQIIDMKEELLNDNPSIVSNALYCAIDSGLRKQQQVMLFINRKGHSNVLKCRQCGETLTCKHCDISMTYYKSKNKMACHYCGNEKALPKQCPECGSAHFNKLGMGTEKAKEVIQELFPLANVAIMDSTTTQKKNAVNRIIDDFQEKRIDILIGTQMITKGLDFENVTVVGVLSADSMFNLPDFTANERTFQLLTQVAGRAGRGDKEGKVFIQTYNPENSAVVYAKIHDYEGFYHEEIQLRKLLNYPPYSKMLNIIITGKDENEIIEVIHRYKKGFETMNSKKYLDKYYKPVEILGPSPALVAYVNHRYRYQLLIKYPIGYQKEMTYVCKNVNKFINENLNCNVIIDINSYKIM